jgi:hypothetical protein
MRIVVHARETDEAATIQTVADGLHALASSSGFLVHTNYRGFDLMMGPNGDPAAMVTRFNAESIATEIVEG